MSGKRAKLIRKAVLSAAPFRGDVEYNEVTKHVKQDFHDMMSGKGGSVVCDPITLTDRCYRKVVKNTKVLFSRLRNEHPLASNKSIADAILANA